MTGGDLDSRPEPTDPNRFDPRRATASSHSFYRAEFARQLAFGGAVLAAAEADPKVREAELEKLIQQGLKEVVMHEVGHTLGLRHNFKASKYRTLADLIATGNEFQHVADAYGEAVEKRILRSKKRLAAMISELTEYDGTEMVATLVELSA